MRSSFEIFGLARRRSMCNRIGMQSNKIKVRVEVDVCFVQTTSPTLRLLFLVIHGRRTFCLYVIVDVHTCTFCVRGTGNRANTQKSGEVEERRSLEALFRWPTLRLSLTIADRHSAGACALTSVANYTSWRKGGRDEGT